VPLRINIQEQKQIFARYKVSWTPTIVILDGKGEEHYRFTGFLPAKEICARIILNAAKTAFDLKQYDQASILCSRVINEYAETFAVPESVYYQGVVAYNRDQEAKELRRALNRLRREFPDSEWTLRAKPYEKIEK
jgi:outer membrane protein assembly factor BamD (BamD/ComL family)